MLPLKALRLSAAAFFLCICFGVTTFAAQENGVSYDIVEAIDSLRTANRDISVVSYALRNVGLRARSPTPRGTPYQPDSPEGVAVITRTAILLSPTRAVMGHMRRLARHEGYIISPGDGFQVLYPAVLGPYLGRESALLIFLESDTDNILEAIDSNKETLVRMFAATEELESKALEAEAALSAANSQVQQLEQALQVENQATESLNAELSNWVNLLSSARTFSSDRPKRPNYSPADDPCIPVLQQEMVSLERSGIPYRKWDGVNGVATPYLDKELVTNLAEFYSREKETLIKLGAANLAIESAARTPTRAVALRDSGNQLAVDAFSSNHLNGTAVDFTGAAQFDYSRPGLSNEEIQTRQRNHAKLAKLLGKYGIVLGTTGKNGKPDPMHASLASTAKPASPERLRRTASIVAAYASCYSRIRQTLKAREDAAHAIDTRVRQSLSLINSLLQQATNKCAQLEGQLASAKALNTSLRSQIRDCQNAYSLIESRRRSESHSFDRSDLRDRLDRGESITETLRNEMQRDMERFQRDGYTCHDTSSGDTISYRCEKWDGDRGSEGGLEGGRLP